MLRLLSFSLLVVIAAVAAVRPQRIRHWNQSVASIRGARDSHGLPGDCPCEDATLCNPVTKVHEREVNLTFVTQLTPAGPLLSSHGDEMS